MKESKKINYRLAKEKIDREVRQFWEGKGYEINPKFYFAATSSFNWFGFIERINECIENPTWEEIKGFVQYYCTHYDEKEYNSYLELYSELEARGYSPVIEERDLEKKWVKKANKPDAGIYKFIFDFYESNYPTKIK